MIAFSETQLESYIAGNLVVVGDASAPGIMQTPEGHIVKSFYRRKRFATSTVFPKFSQFIKNCERLRERGITAPSITEVYACRARKLHLVEYERLPGHDIRSLCEEGDYDALEQLPQYLADLHDRGVYFRAIHLGNVLATESQSMALIDIADLSVATRELGGWQRARNVSHLLNCDEDRSHFVGFGVKRFLTAYLEAASLSPIGAALFHAWLSATVTPELRAHLPPPARKAAR